MADFLWYLAAARFPVAASFRCSADFRCRQTSCVRRTEDGRSRARGSLDRCYSQNSVPGLGYISVALSGITRLSLPRFLTLDGIGAVFYVAVPVVLGRVFHNAVDAALATFVHSGEYGVGSF